MGSHRYFWDDEEGGNVEHIEEHGLTPDDVEEAFQCVLRHTTSRSSRRPALFGLTHDGRLIFVVYEEIDEGLVYVHTAYEPLESE
jgi:uncharacterized DUF497 family protein